MRIEEVKEQRINEIREKTPYGLPDDPSANGMSAEQVKKAFYGPLTDDEISVIAEINRVVREANKFFENLEVLTGSGLPPEATGILGKLYVDEKNGKVYLEVPLDGASPTFQQLIFGKHLEELKDSLDEKMESLEEEVAASKDQIHIGADEPESEDAVLWIDDDEEGLSAEGGQSDWNQNDPTQSDYVKNRTHYEKIDVVFESSAEYDEEEMFTFATNSTFAIVEGESYKVNWNGAEYECVGKAVSDAEGAFFLGNGVTVGLEDTGEPFVILTADGVVVGLDNNGATSVTVSISAKTVVKIPEKYIPVQEIFYIEGTRLNSEDVPGVYNVDVSTPKEDIIKAYHEGRTMCAKLIIPDGIGFPYILPATQAIYYAENNAYAFRFSNAWINDYDCDGTIIDFVYTFEVDGMTLATVQQNILYARGEVDRLLNEKISTPAAAEVGQTIVVKSVDENGKITVTGLDEIALLIETDTLPAVYNADGKILTDQNGSILLRH